MKRGKLALVLLVLIFSVGCDQATKIAARAHLEGQPQTSYLGDLFRLTYAENSGAFLGMGAQLPETVRTLLFVAVVTILLGGALLWVFRNKNMSRTLVLAISLIVGGGIGNLIDRVLFDGRVTDFMNMGIGTLRTGIFNVADLWIVFGAVLMFFASEMRQGRTPTEEGDDDDIIEATESTTSP